MGLRSYTTRVHSVFRSLRPLTTFLPPATNEIFTLLVPNHSYIQIFSSYFSESLFRLSRVTKPSDIKCSRYCFGSSEFDFYSSLFHFNRFLLIELKFLQSTRSRLPHPPAQPPSFSYEEHKKPLGFNKSHCPLKPPFTQTYSVTRRINHDLC